jgi:hypothetical protein
MTTIVYRAGANAKHAAACRLFTLLHPKLNGQGHVKHDYEYYSAFTGLQKAGNAMSVNPIAVGLCSVGRNGLN